MPRNNSRSPWERTPAPAACPCTFEAKEDGGLWENNDKLANANRRVKLQFLDTGDCLAR